MAPKHVSEPINQHFVAATYLRSWGYNNKSKNNDDVYVWVRRKNFTKVFEKNPKEIFKVEHLYTIFGENGDRDYSVENWFRDLEGSFSTVRHKVENDPASMSQSDRRTLAFFTASQYYRTPKSTKTFRERIDTANYIMNMIGAKKKIAMIGPGSTSYLLTEEEVVHAQQHPFLNFYLPRIEEFAEDLLKMNLAILKSNAEGSFITSDCPAVLVDRLRENQGLQSSGARLTLPISPKTTVAYNWVHKGVHNISSEDIKIENRIQVAVSVEYIILPSRLPPFV